MNSAEHILSMLRSRGVKIWINADRIHVRFQTGCITAEELSEIQKEVKDLSDARHTSLAEEAIRAQPSLSPPQIPLTDLQRLLYGDIDALGAVRRVRDCVAVARISGALDVHLLKTSVEAVVRRHESLLTRIHVVNGTPLQQVDLAWRCDDLELVDISCHSESSRDAKLEFVLEEFILDEVDLSIESAFRAQIIKISFQQYVLVLATPSIIADAMSVVILMRDIWSLYAQAVGGSPAHLPKLPLKFSDYAIWQEQTRGEWRTRHESYWRGRVEGAKSTPMLFSDLGLTRARRFGTVCELPFGANLTAELRDFARLRRKLFPLLVLSVYLTVMFRWCERKDLLLGFVENGRNRPELTGMVGLLAQVLALRIQTFVEDTFDGFLERVTEEFYSACDHRDFSRVSFIRESEALSLQFNWLPRMESFSTPKEAGDVRIELQALHPFPSKINIPPFSFAPFWFLDSPAGLKVIVVYRPDIVSLETLSTFIKDLRLVAREFIRAPSTRIESVWEREGMSHGLK